MSSTTPVRLYFTATLSRHFRGRHFREVLLANLCIMTRLTGKNRRLVYRYPMVLRPFLTPVVSPIGMPTGQESTSGSLLRSPSPVSLKHSKLSVKQTIFVATLYEINIIVTVTTILVLTLD